jgi:hypothetical protein
MTEDTNTSVASTQAVNATTSPALAATPETPAVDGAETPISLEEAKKLRTAEASLRKRLKAYEDAEQHQKDAALSDVQKATKRAEELEQKYQQERKQRIDALVQLAASKKDIIDPDLAALAITPQLEFDDQGMPTNLDQLLDNLLKNKPYLAKAAQTPTASAPQFTANNPGRTAINQPGQTPQGRRPTLFDENIWRR